jgi:hypothetical protein
VRLNGLHLRPYSFGLFSLLGRLYLDRIKLFVEELHPFRIIVVVLWREQDGLVVICVGFRERRLNVQCQIILPHGFRPVLLRHAQGWQCVECVGLLALGKYYFVEEDGSHGQCHFDLRPIEDGFSSLNARRNRPGIQLLTEELHQTRFVLQCLWTQQVGFISFRVGLRPLWIILLGKRIYSLRQQPECVRHDSSRLLPNSTRRHPSRQRMLRALLH